MNRILQSTFALFLLLGSAQAEDVVPAEDIIKSLKASAPSSDTIDASTIVQNLKAQIAVVPRDEQAATQSLQTPELDALATLNIEIFFEYNSAVVKQGSLPTLVQLGNALVSNELSASNFLIVGHTDAKGERDYNISLSERRAAAVMRFLEASFPASKNRLSSIGFGAEKLRNIGNPESEENRRVQVVNLGAAK
jgi:OmpA-OmpF porin, OOP family